MSNARPAVAALVAGIVLVAAPPARSDPWFEVFYEGDTLVLFDEGSVRMLHDGQGGPSTERIYATVQAVRSKQTRTDVTWRVDCSTWNQKPHRLVVRDASGRVQDDFIASGPHALWEQAREGSIAEDLAIMACTTERLGHPLLTQPADDRVAGFLGGG